MTIVDRMLPALDGLTLVKHLREQRYPPALMRPERFVAYDASIRRI
jgi:DNA-binding response OmpR family regulator